jgi:hypothetical protein
VALDIRIFEFGHIHLADRARATASLWEGDPTAYCFLFPYGAGHPAIIAVRMW